MENGRRPSVNGEPKQKSTMREKLRVVTRRAVTGGTLLAVLAAGTATACNKMDGFSSNSGKSEPKPACTQVVQPKVSDDGSLLPSSGVNGRCL